MKYLMLFVDGFEDTEAIATLDVLQRGGDKVVCASVTDSKHIVTKCNINISVDCFAKDCNYLDFDALIIPGGPGSFKIMPNLPIVEKLIKEFADNKKLVASICAAPHLVGKLGYLKNHNFTVYPGFEEQIIGGFYQKNYGVVTDGKFITAKSMFYSIDFGLAIHEYFHGKESAMKLKLACQGEK